MHIACYELPDWEKEYLKKKFENTLEMSFHTETLSLDNISDAKDDEAIVIFINSKITKEILDKMPNLKFIATMSTGFDHIDIEECKNRHIVVSTVPTYGENTVAEHAFALIFAISRRIIESHDRVKDGNFSPIGLTGFDLYGKTLGVLGVGNIGTHAIRIAKGIGMDVVAYKRTPDPKLAADLGFRFVSMEELYAQSDIITIHTPYTKENYHLINKENISKMKRGIYIINTARGALIDTEALIWGINEGIIAGAGLDVLEGERDLKIEKEIVSAGGTEQIDYKIIVEDQILIDMPQVIVTHHIAFYSKEAETEIIKTTVENIKGFVSGNVQNLVK